MSIKLIASIIIIGLWIIGGIVAIAIMLVRSLTHPGWDNYTTREFFIGFIGSWYTVAVLAEIIKDDL